MLGTGGKISIQVVLAQASCSARVLQKRFADAVGLSLKQFLAIVRLSGVVDQITYLETEDITLTGLTLEYDYYDSHISLTTRTTPCKFKPSLYLLSLKK
ncbi:helix-turn-helix domain-containing protein [Flammeovirgaceae bacterium 311]|nr:helix-turn-helix domain-containing protein [Flammeovirgaceae bacterium 311]